MSNASAAHPEPSVEAVLTLDLGRPGPTIERNLYGHFAEHLGRGIYEGLWVGPDSPVANVRGIRSDVVAALKELNPPVLRWPGGCFADEYHWRDGVGPRDRRPKMFNSHWGGVVENNHFGTHEFMDLCEQIGAAPYVCGNVGSGTVREMMEWVEYMTSEADTPMANLRRAHGRKEPYNLRYFGVGNESWGCGGNMRPEFYADNYRRYATFVKNYTKQPIQRIACGPNGADHDWTEVLMKQAGRQMEGLSLHWYTLPTQKWSQKGAATGFSEHEWHSTLTQALRMDGLVGEHSAIMDKYDPEKRVGLIVDEWGTWYDVEPGTNPGFLYQQNSLRDAIVTAVTLNVFNQHAERVKMANIAQMVNVLQAVILTRGEQMLRTPTYHVFEMYKVHQGGTRIPLALSTPDYVLSGARVPVLHASASRAASGTVHLTVANLDPKRSASLTLARLSGQLSGRVLTAESMDAHNSFENPDALRPQPFLGQEREGESFRLALPAKSLVALQIESSEMGSVGGTA
jgi:alpha-L-arabinofuranosidase